MKILGRIVDGISEVFLKISIFLTALQINAGQAGYFNPIITTGVQTETMRSVGTPPINDAHVDLFANNIYHVSQQQGSMLMPFVLVEGMVMNAKQINRIGSLPDPALYTGRGSKVTATNPVNDNRWITAQRYWHACFVDKWDQLRTLWDIRNAYTQAMSMSFGRLYDRVIISAALGTVWAGPRRTVQVPLPSTQKVAPYDTTSAEGSGLNLQALMDVRKKMKKFFAAQRGSSIVMVITAEETNSLLAETKLTNRDYTTVMALMQGEISAFFGFIFVETQLVPHTDAQVYYLRKNVSGIGRAGDVITAAQHTTATTADAANAGTMTAGRGLRCFAFMSGDSVCFGINQNLMARVSERADLHYNIQIYFALEVGAVRKEEVKVVEIVTRDFDVA